jgi:hypothetical protein
VSPLRPSWLGGALAASCQHGDLTFCSKFNDECFGSRSFGRAVSPLSSVGGIEFGLGNLACLVGCVEPDADVVFGVRGHSCGVLGMWGRVFHEGSCVPTRRMECPSNEGRVRPEVNPQLNRVASGEEDGERTSTGVHFGR